jgi:hypothetical protein
MQLSTRKFDSTSLLEKYSSVTSSMDALMDLFKSGAQPTPTLTAEPKAELPAETPAVADKLPALENASSSEPQAPAENIPVASSQEVKPVVVEAPVKVKKLAKRRSKRSKLTKDPLIGTMVALTLSSGREVRGVLEERSATAYKIQLPGMGPFTYDAANVKSIRAAK